MNIYEARHRYWTQMNEQTQLLSLQSFPILHFDSERKLASQEGVSKYLQSSGLGGTKFLRTCLVHRGWAMNGTKECSRITCIQWQALCVLSTLCMSSLSTATCDIGTSSPGLLMETLKL